MTPNPPLRHQNQQGSVCPSGEASSARPGERKLVEFLRRRGKSLAGIAPQDFVRFRAEMWAQTEEGTLTRHQAQRRVAEARECLRRQMEVGQLDRERFFLLLHPKIARGDLDPRLLHSRAFAHLTSSVAACYRRGAQALLIELQARGKDLASLDAEHWKRFREQMRARVVSGELSRPLARMRVAGARLYLREQVRLGRVGGETLSASKPSPPEAVLPKPLALWPARLEDALAAAGLAESTRAHYALAVRDLLAHLAHEGIEDLTQATREVMTGYQLALQQHAPRTGRPYAVSTQVGLLAALRFFFAYLVKAGYLLTDPTTHLVYPRAPRRLPRPLSIEAMRRLLDALPKTPLGRRDRTILELLYGTGMRGGELTRLRLQDLDLEAGAVLIREGKGKKDRMVPLGRTAKQALLSYLEEVRGALLRGTSNAVFLARHGGALSGRGMRRKLSELGARLGLKLHPHLLRHTCATHLLKGRADIRHIQRLLGHKSLQTTERYTRVEVSDLREVIRRCHPREKGR